MKALAVLENDKVGVIELEKPENLSENEVLNTRQSFFQ